jgi:hypothetical protein
VGGGFWWNMLPGKENPLEPGTALECGQFGTVTHPMVFARNVWCCGPTMEHSLAYIEFKKVFWVTVVKKGEINQAWKLSVTKARLLFLNPKLLAVNYPLHGK